MKKLILCLLALVLMLGLAACSSTDSDMTDSTASKIESDTSSKMESSTMSDTTESDTHDLESSKTEGTTSTNDDMELRDGKYRAEAEDYDSDGYKPYVELTVSEGKISEIDMNAKDKDGNSKKDNDTFKDWIDNTMLFEKEVVAKGLENIKIETDGSVTDIGGKTINVGEYTELLDEALNKARS